MEQFDRDRPLFDRRLRVLVQYPDRDEKLRPLTIRLLNGVRQNASKNQKERVFRVEITDDDGVDPYFLYLWSVSEEEFHELKQQQRLLVDFPTFPSNLIELLQCCLKDSKKLSSHDDVLDKSEGDGEENSAVEGEESTKETAYLEKKNATSRVQGPVPLSYLAVLNTCDAEGESVFSIVETNPFKHLTHLSLQFFPGDDAAIKAYLAARLAQVNAEKSDLSSRFNEASTTLRRTKSHEQTLAKQLDTLTQQTESELAREKMKFSDDLNAQREQAAKLLKEREDELNARLQALTQRYEEEVKALRIRADENDALVQSLQKTKYQQELQITQLTSQSHDLSSGKTVLSDELHSLRAENKSLDQKVFEQEKKINQLEMKVVALNQQVTDKEEVISKTTELLHAAQHHKQEVEDSLKMYRDNHVRLQQKLELSVAEINKGNEIIERIQNENRTLKAKMKMKGKILKQQEDLIDEKQHQREEALLELKSSRDDIRKRDEQISSLKDRVNELTAKLEESNKLLASNQQVITWLNKEINEAQISQHRRTSAHPQVYSFRPSGEQPPPQFNASGARP
ncbi:hypothetical protein Poli38472_010568 [Pythium oligandrum]|uniref:Spindle assembly abnormal protein 6 N-terminal domain-containing protein n=1 Tax=Pythium oligandrum TaxID=41045 RepID=A0A8K1C392_PYTOL|nr:hypothetical protein Poli38472_010568 [Pythium oligandrum]|eukprot:TMW55686.1 hypothetical protein Poli38472_010568 [Pythium oligandrum]